MFGFINLLPILNMQMPFTQRPSVGDLPPPISPTRITLSLLLLAARRLFQRTPPPEPCPHKHDGTSSHGRWAILQQFAADYIACTPKNKLLPLPKAQRLWHCDCFAQALPRSSVAIKRLADGGLVPIQQLGYLRLVVSGFHEGVYLVSFSLAEMFVFHKQLRVQDQEALNATHPQPPPTIS